MGRRGRIKKVVFSCIVIWSLVRILAYGTQLICLVAVLLLLLLVLQVNLGCSRDSTCSMEQLVINSLIFSLPTQPRV